jgi:hypothetical protein
VLCDEFYISHIYMHYYVLWGVFGMFGMY